MSNPMYQIPCLLIKIKHQILRTFFFKAPCSPAERDFRYAPSSFLQGILDCKEFCLFFDSLAVQFNLRTSGKQCSGMDNC